MNSIHDRNWVIYKMVSPSGRIYIGKSSNFAKRMNYYKNLGVKSQSQLYRSLMKYGFDSHNAEIIDQFIGSDNHASSKEMFWIRSYMSNKCKWAEMRGLNLTDGGEGTTGYKASEEHRKKLSEIHKKNPTRGRLGKKCSEEQKQKLRDYNKKNPPKGMLGKKMSQETKDKIKETKLRNGTIKPKTRVSKISKEELSKKLSAALKGRKVWNKGLTKADSRVRNNIEKTKKSLKEKYAEGKITIWNKGKKFDDLTEEQKKKRFGAHNIGHTRNRGRKYSEEYKKEMSEKRKGIPNIALYKPILQFTNKGIFIKEYHSIKEASKLTGLSCWTIGNIAKGLRATSHHFIFKYK